MHHTNSFEVMIVLIFNLHLGQLGWGTTGDLSHSQVEQFGLQLIELLNQLLLLLGTEFRALHFHLQAETTFSLLHTNTFTKQFVEFNRHIHLMNLKVLSLV